MAISTIGWARKRPSMGAGAVLVVAAQVTGAEKAVFGETFGRQLQCFEVADHAARRLDQDFAVVGNAGLHARVGSADAAGRMGLD